jgi:hypothetical protein
VAIRHETQSGKKASSGRTHGAMCSEGFQHAYARYRTAAKRLMIDALPALSTKKARGRPKFSSLTAFGNATGSDFCSLLHFRRDPIARRAAKRLPVTQLAHASSS